MRSISPRRSTLAAALVLAIAGWPPLSAASADTPPLRAAEDGAPESVRSHDITLVTGDVVHFTDLPGSRDVVTVEPAADSSGPVQVYTRGEDTYVVPSDAMPLLAAGRVDPRLFNVTDLVAMGYDDARADSVPLIATPSSVNRSATPPPAPAGSRTVRTLASIRSTVLSVDKERSRAFWQGIAPGGGTWSPASGVGKLWLDGRVEAALAASTAQVKAPEAWSKGFDGSGVKVAVLDTGADLDHPDLQGRVDEAKSFVPGEGVDDGNGHGTHVASTVGGSGAASGGAEKGVAPGARLLIGKVLADSGAGADSGVIAGMEWARAQGADVVSMSLGSNDSSGGDDPMSLALDALSADGGPLYVVAAGNSYSPGSIGAPGAAKSALTVAAVDAKDKRADFSSQGPLTGSHGLKPDLSAPGVGVLAAASQSVPGWSGGMYRSMNGTSMATPHVSGAAAVLKQRHPEWSGQRIKDALMSASHTTNGKPYETGTGRLDVETAVDTVIDATGSVPAAVYQWPHTGDVSSTRTVTYRNSGDGAVTLDLALDTADSAYSLSASSVTVPARGSAEVTLTLDPSRVPVDTTFSGRIAATDAATGKVVAHTGFALYKERELYDYTIKVTGRDGKPARDTVVVNSPHRSDPMYVNVDGETTLRLPPGDYTAWSFMEVPGDTSDGLGMALLLDPTTTVDAAHPSGEVRLDASRARRAYALPERESTSTQTILDFSRAYETGPVTSAFNWNSALLLPAAYDSLYLSPTQPVTKGSLDTLIHWRMREKALDAETGSGREIALTAQRNSPFHEGTSTLRTVYAGKGSTADYAGLDVRGKAVVVDRSTEVPIAERVRAASEAGAALLISVNDTRGRLYESATAGGSMPVASVMQRDGELLIAEARSGRGKLHVRQKEYPDYTYDLLQTFKGSIPDTPLVHRPEDDDLARVESTYNATPGTLGQGSRHFAPTWGPAVGTDEYERYSRAVTEFVAQHPAGLGTWYEQHAGSGTGAGFAERNVSASYTAGKRYRAAWFAPVTAPRLSDGSNYVAQQNVSGTFQWNVAMWSSGHDGHLGVGGTGTKTTLYRDGTQVATSNSQSGRAWNAPQGRYELVATGQRASAAWPTSTRTRTAWGFDYLPLPANGAVRADVPLLNLDYDVATDIQGKARAGHRLDLGLRSTTYTGEIAATAASLQVSYDDGATWRPAPLKRTGEGRWATVLQSPDDASSISLRATSEAPGGLSVEQEVIRAVLLK
ncbi:S8 family serine peptidase [Streptomyces filamentosus]|uniref:Peptidase n=1 Tax=Streptomyces filamentosus TaxID=67294 RepID=A0A919BB82_STRFL|nr:S8 family serine peptidase [Streptomyces filamentosus]GHF77411.1 peptidase [Streptomyces filamentosus]